MYMFRLYPSTIQSHTIESLLSEAESVAAGSTNYLDYTDMFETEG